MFFQTSAGSTRGIPPFPAKHRPIQEDPVMRSLSKAKWLLVEHLFQPTMKLWTLGTTSTSETLGSTWIHVPTFPRFAPLRRWLMNGAHHRTSRRAAVGIIIQKTSASATWTAAIYPRNSYDFMTNAISEKLRKRLEILPRLRGGAVDPLLGNYVLIDEGFHMQQLSGWSVVACH